MKKYVALVATLLLLTACGVDTTGLSATSSRTPTGNPDSGVTVTEFGDLECPACRAAYTLLTQPIIQKYGKQVSFVFKHFPLQSIHPYALQLAEAAECAADQGKFWEYVDTDYTKQPDLNAGSSREWAASLGLDMKLFDRCTASHIKRKEILADYDEGTKLGVQGTPTFFVNGVQVESTMDALSAAIDTALSGSGQRL